MECNTSHPKTKNERLLTGVHVCEQTLCAPRSLNKKSEIFLSHLKVQNIHHFDVISSLTDIRTRHRGRQGSHVMKFFLFWPHFSTHSLTLCNQNILKGQEGRVMVISISRTDTGALRFCPIFHLYVDTSSLLSPFRLPAVPPLPLC